MVYSYELQALVRTDCCYCGTTVCCIETVTTLLLYAVRADRAQEGVESLLQAMNYDAALSAMEQARALYTQVLMLYKNFIIEMQM